MIHDHTRDQLSRVSHLAWLRIAKIRTNRTISPEEKVWFTVLQEWMCNFYLRSLKFSSVTQSCPTLATQWTAVFQASLSITDSQSFPKLTSIELVMPSNHLILCCPLLLPPSISIRIFSNESQFFASGGQNIGVSASASLPRSVGAQYATGEEWRDKSRKNEET